MSEKQYYAALGMVILVVVMILWTAWAGSVSLADVMGAGVETVEVEAER